MLVGNDYLEERSAEKFFLFTSLSILSSRTSKLRGSETLITRSRFVRPAIAACQYGKREFSSFLTFAFPSFTGMGQV